MDEEHVPVELRAHLMGQWWYFAGMLRAILNRKREETGLDDWQWLNSPNPDGCVLHIGPKRKHAPIATALFVDKDEKTLLVVHTAAGNEHVFQQMVDNLKKAAYEAHEARRASLGATFKEILDQYYAARARGERVRLVAMAENAGVKYDSLRQAKVRYDREHDKV